MNDSNPQETLWLKQRLEEVTAADAPVAGDSKPRDSDATSLREAWLGFGQLVRAADDSLPTIALAMPEMAAPRGPQKSHRLRWLRFVAAAAAILLVAVTFGLLTHPLRVSPATGGSSASSTTQDSIAAGLARQELPETTLQAATATVHPINAQPTKEQPRAVAVSPSAASAMNLG